MRLLLFLYSLSLLFFAVAPPPEPKPDARRGRDIATTRRAFTLTAHNNSAPDINGKDLYIHTSGFVYLDAGQANPPFSYKLLAFLEDTKLRRIRQNDPSPGSAPGTEGNLPFGTSQVCCDYAHLNFSTPNDIPSLPTRTTPFYLARPGRRLVFGDSTSNERRPFYVCNPKDGLFKPVYYNKPWNDYPNHGDTECTAVRLVAKIVRNTDLPQHDPAPVPPK